MLSPSKGSKPEYCPKITAMKMIQYINKFIFNRNINNLKVNIT